MKAIDARGKNHPEPVLLTKAQTDRGATELEILLDNPVAASNVRQFLESKGFGVQLRDDDGMLMISAHVKSPAELASAGRSEKQIPRQAPAPKVQVRRPIQTAGPASSKETFSVLITCRHLGQNDQGLGEVLMKSFLGTLSQSDDAPLAIALMNEGAKLALYDSSTCDHLKNLEKKGTVILICGVCVNHFQIADHLGAGKLSNMSEILEILKKANKIITL